MISPRPTWSPKSNALAILWNASWEASRVAQTTSNDIQRQSATEAMKLCGRAFDYVFENWVKIVESSTVENNRKVSK